MLKPLFILSLIILTGCQRPLNNVVKTVLIDKTTYYIPTHIIVCLDIDCKTLTAIKEAIICVNATCMKWKAQYSPLDEEINDPPPDSDIVNTKCNPNFYIGARGNIHFKPQCFIK